MRDSAGSLAMFTAMRHARDTALFRQAAAKSVTDPPPWGVIPFLTVLRMGLMTIRHREGAAQDRFGAPAQLDYPIIQLGMISHA